MFLSELFSDPSAAFLTWTSLRRVSLLSPSEAATTIMTNVCELTVSRVHALNREDEEEQRDGRPAGHDLRWRRQEKVWGGRDAGGTEEDERRKAMKDWRGGMKTSRLKFIQITCLWFSFNTRLLILFILSQRKHVSLLFIFLSTLFKLFFTTNKNLKVSLQFSFNLLFLSVVVDQSSLFGLVLIGRVKPAALCCSRARSRV